MRVAWLLPALLLLPGCVDQPVPPSPALRSFHAELADGTAVVLAGPSPFQDRDGQERLGHLLQVGDDAYVLDASLRVVRQDLCDGDACVTTWTEPHLPPHGVAWPLVPGLPYPVTVEGGTTVVVADDVRYVYEADLLMPKAAQRVGPPGPPADRSPLFVRASLELGEPLAAAEPWAAAGSRPAAGAWQNPLFPDAGQDLLGFGYTPLEAFEALKAYQPRAAATLALGGCVAGTWLREQATLFFVQAPAGDIDLYLVRRATGPGLPFQVHAAGAPNGLDGLSCEERQALPWPSYGMAAFLEESQAAPLEAMASVGPTGYVAIAAGLTAWADPAAGDLVRIAKAQ